MSTTKPAAAAAAAPDTGAPKQAGLVLGTLIIVAAVANLPPRPVLQAQFLRALQGPSASLVGVLSSPMQGLLAVLHARAQQIEASQAA